MAKCDCSGRTCNCLVVAGAGVEITGSGSAANPYVVNADIGSVRDLLRVYDTTSVDLSLTGAGTVEDPLILSAIAHPRLLDLADVGDTGPLNGETIVWVGGGNGSWSFAAGTTAAAGSLTVGAGLLGDGSIGDELTVATSGLWGSGPLSGWGSDSTVGLQVYVDSAGQLRAEPISAPETISWSIISGKPTTFPPDIGTTVTTAAAGNHTHTWASILGKPITFPPDAHTHDDRYYTEAEVASLVAIAKAEAISSAVATADTMDWNKFDNINTRIINNTVMAGAVYIRYQVSTGNLVWGNGYGFEREIAWM